MRYCTKCGQPVYSTPKRCLQCKEIFKTGPGAKRRRDAIFCSVQCNVKFKSLKRSRPVKTK